ncbi:MAG: protein kinase [Pirellulales bacterium]|nr:protein kinase [Pirellulales bacterium]
MNGPHDDERKMELLDGYLARLQAGEAPDRESVLDEHPELASALDCLEALEELAPSPAARTLGSKDDTLDLGSSMGGLPRAFGQYELLSEIGRGGMGVVYKARQKSLDRVVAVKMILSSHLASPEHIRRFQDEAKAAARLRHPHIVPIHEVGQLHGQDYFAMEYVDGESLGQRIARSPLDMETAVRLVAAIARAVDHLHEQKIIHRDLKPSNVLLDAEEHPYLTDFGLAKISMPGSEATATGVITGTPSYMAPEQASGHGSLVGPSADIYSLGAILYELLTGRPPFREENPLDTLMEVLSREPTLPRKLNPRVPRELELICLKCLAKMPEERYASAGALADDLDHFARGEALEVRPPHLGQRLWSWTRRKPALASRFVALGLFYLAFLAVEAVKYWVAGRQGEPPVVVWAFHWQMLVVLAVWTTASVVCQHFLESRRWSFPARYVWGMLDSLLLLAALLLADGVASPLVIGYGLLIVGAGLWFRVRFVTFITVLSLLSYGVLIVDFYYRRPELQQRFDADPDRHVINILALILLGAVVAYLVHRVRTLSTFYGRQIV